MSAISEGLNESQYIPTYGITVNRTEGLLHDAGARISVNVSESSSSLIQTNITVIASNYNATWEYFSSSCSNSSFCHFNFTLDYPTTKYDVKLIILRNESGTPTERSYEFEYITRGSGFVQVGTFDDSGEWHSDTGVSRIVWMFIWLVLTLTIVGVSYMFLGVASLLAIFVMVGIGCFVGIYTIQEAILIGIVLLIILKAVI